MIWNDIYRRQKGNDYDQKTKMLKDLYITLDRVKRVHMNGDMKTIVTIYFLSKPDVLFYLAAALIFLKLSTHSCALLFGTTLILSRESTISTFPVFKILSKAIFLPAFTKPPVLVSM
jgi:hypothetical protein